MAAPTIYRSTDSSAPVLSGTVGTLVNLLDKCLVAGYGSKTAAGWTKPYTGTNQAVFRPGAGPQHYLQVDDAGGMTGGARDAQCSGWETMSAYNTGTGQFPTAALAASLVVGRKSTSADSTARAWLLLADDRTAYLFVVTGDSTTQYLLMLGFGEFYSYVSADAYRSLIFGHGTSTASALSAHNGAAFKYGAATGAFASHWLPRNFSGSGGATALLKCGDNAMIPVSSTSDATPAGAVFFPNPADGGFYVSPIRLLDGSTPGSTIAGNICLRGRLRGLAHAIHPQASFTDGDSFSGVGEYAGKTLMVVKPILAAATNGILAVETTTWETSS